MKDKIVIEVRKIRKQIESEKGDDWNTLSKYYVEKQNHHKERMYKGKPNRR